MDSQSIMDKWIKWDDKQIMSHYEILTQILEDQEVIMKTLTHEGNHWEAFKTLNLMFLYCSSQMESDVSNFGVQRNMPHTIYALLDWISCNKQLLDEITQGIGGYGYGISTSTHGMNISVSFSSGDLLPKNRAIPNFMGW